MSTKAPMPRKGLRAGLHDGFGWFEVEDVEVPAEIGAADTVGQPTESLSHRPRERCVMRSYYFDGGECSGRSVPHGGGGAGIPPGAAPS